QLTAAPYAFDAYDSHYLGGVSWSEYATDSELSTPGTINSSGNPVDWTKLKNVPAGFADGTDDAGGSGDGHSLDAADGDPADVVYVSNVGYVGVGTASPTCELHINEQYGLAALLSVTNSNTGTTSTDGFQIGIMSNGDGRLMNFEDRDIVFGANGRELLELTPEAVLNLASAEGDAGRLRIYAGTGTHSVHDLFTDADGGQFELNDEAGNLAVLVEADDSGAGGRLQVSRDANYHADKGIDLNGNWASTEQPALRVMGSSRQATFLMNESGNASVSLPSDAIYDYEILDEPGVAGICSSGSMALEGGGNPLASRSIVVPSSGYVLAIASCQAQINHVYGSWNSIDIGVSDNCMELPATQTTALTVDSNLPTGTYSYPLTSHGLFEVSSAGTHTFCYLAYVFYGTVHIGEPNLTLVFLPTAYGDVVPTMPGEPGAARDTDEEPRGPLTDAEVAAERAEAEAFNLARIERELAEIQAQVEAMKEN
ncbi:MAG TPA: hypothetical protein VE960_05195, partial [bacterium]|nr:hypothetical protein [bacterium]